MINGKLAIEIDNAQIAHSRHHKGAAIFIDVEQTFDSVWQNGLRYKLMNTNLPDKIVRLMSSFLNLQENFSQNK